MHGPFDIIIDDASHISPLSIRSFEILFKLLKRGGIYVIEDLHVFRMPGYLPYGIDVLSYLESIKYKPEIKECPVYMDKIAFIRKA